MRFDGDFRRAARRLALTLSAAAVLWPSASRALDWPGKRDEDLAALSSPSPNVRLAALQRIARYQGAGGEFTRGSSDKFGTLVRRQVLQALSDSSNDVRIYAAKVAAEYHYVEATRELVRWLSDSAPPIRIAAAEALGQLPTGSATAALSRALADPEPKVRIAVAQALGRSETVDGRELVSLIGALDDTSSKVREAVVELLTTRRDPRAVIPLIARLRDASHAVRQRAAAALAELGDSGAGPAIVRLLHDPTPQVASAAVDALAALRFARATLPLIDLFKNGPAALRDRTAEALAQIGTAPAVAAIVAALSRESHRQAAKAALLNVGPTASVQLAEILRDPRTPRPVLTTVVEVAREARLAALVPALIETLQAKRLPTLLLVEALGEIGDGRAERVLLQLTLRPGLDVRLAALKALESTMDLRAAEPLLACLNDTNADVRVRAIGLLGQLQTRIATPQLIQLARGTEPKVAHAALSALASAADPRATETLLDLLIDSEDLSRRRLAMLALARNGDRRATTRLLRFCRTADGEPRLLCLQALAGTLRDRRDEQAVGLIGELLRSGNELSQRGVIAVVAAMADPKGAQALVAAYDSLPSGLRPHAIDALGSAREEALGTVTPLLARAMRSGDPKVRSAAAWAMGKLPGVDDARIPTLIRAARDRTWFVRTNAAAALARLRPTAARDVLRPLLSDPVSYVRANAALGLASLRGPDTVRALAMRLASDPSPWVRLNALRALVTLRVSKLKLPDARQELPVDDVVRSLSLHDPDPRVRAIVAKLPRSAPSAPPTSWIGLRARDLNGDSLAHQVILLVTPPGLIKAAIADDRGEVFEERLAKGRCHAELAPPNLAQGDSEI